MIPIRDNEPASNPPVATYALIAINVLVFFFESTLNVKDLQVVSWWLGVVPERFWPETDVLAIPTLITNAFLHGGLMHLIGNMWTLYLFGDNVEDRMGSGRFVLFYLLCAIIAALTHIAANLGSPVPAIGASGAVAGVMGAYLLWYPRARILVLVPILVFPLFFELSSVIYLGIWFATQLFSGSISFLYGQTGASGIAFWAHVGGFVAGMVVCNFMAKKPAEMEDLYALQFPVEAAWRDDVFSLHNRD